MAHNILLLDCSDALRDTLERLGYNVQAGTVGFANGVRNLPGQIYESSIIVYNPQKLFRNDLERNIFDTDINDETPEFPLAHLKDHFARGAIVLVFANFLGEGVRDTDQETAYNWIPFMPRMEFTKDSKVYAEDLSSSNYRHFLPLQNVNDVKTPVSIKLKTYSHNEPDFEYDQSRSYAVVPVFKNANHETLGIIKKHYEGHLIVLPTYKSNDEQVITLLSRVLKLKGPLDSAALYEFVSPKETAAIEELSALASQEVDLKTKIQSAQEEVETLRRIKIQTIDSDETAVLIKSYYATAVQQKDVALFFLFKIIEAIENKYGSEKLAKDALVDVNRQWNLIGTVANASYRDIRHAPKPGEKVKQWSEEEAKSAFDAAVEIIRAYFKTLF